MPVFCLYWGYWRDRYASTPEQIAATAAEYARRLVGCTPKQARQGLERAKAQKFAPNPSEFASLCRPRLTDSGAPSLEAVTAEIRQRHAKRGEPHDWSHPLCWHIDSACGGAIHELPAAAWLAAVAAEYAKWEIAVADGAVITEPTRALPPPPQQTPAGALAASLGIDISKPRYIPPNRRQA